MSIAGSCGRPVTPLARGGPTSGRRSNAAEAKRRDGFETRAWRWAMRHLAALMKYPRRVSMGVVLLAVGCGGAIASDPLDGTGPGGTSPPSGSSAGSGSGGAVSTGGSTGSGSAGSSGGGNTGGTSGGGNTGGASGGTVHTATGIACGASTCVSGSEECCVGGGEGGDVSASCSPTGTCEGDAALGCSSSASCTAPGLVCCLDPRGETPTATCKATCGAGESESLQLCASNAECKTGTCQSTPIGVGVCRRTGGGGRRGGGGAPPPRP